MTLRSKLLKSAIFIPFLALLLVYLITLNFDLNHINQFRDFLFGTRPPFPTVVSSLRNAGSPYIAQIIWLDNDRLIVPAVGPNFINKTSSTNKTDSLALYIWNTKTGEYIRHVALPGIPSILCYRSGQLVYSVESSPDENIRLYAGPIGYERPLDPNIKAHLQPDLMRCKNIQSSFRPEHVNAINLPLQEGDGYINIGFPKIKGEEVFTNASQNEPVTLYSPTRSKGIILPITIKEMSLASTTYSQYENLYTIVPGWPKNKPFSNHVTSWPVSQFQPIYLLSTDGIKEIVTLPPGLWTGRPIVAPTKKGLFIVSTAVSNGYSGQAGGYILMNGKMTKLYDHMTTATGVSPDGCKIAFSYNDYNPHTQKSLKLINLCN